MDEPRKEYRARIWVKLTEDLLPTPMLSAADVQSRLAEVLCIGDPDSPFVLVVVDDPRK